MAKGRISATIDPKTEKILDEITKNGRYRNRSHAIEEAIMWFAEEKYGKNKK